jgi:hypothetical protein
MTEEITRRPNGAYLIESAPNRRQYLAAKSAREIVERITAPIAAAVAGYKSELDRMLDAQAIYLGPGK